MKHLALNLLLVLFLVSCSKESIVEIEKPEPTPEEVVGDPQNPSSPPEAKTPPPLTPVIVDVTTPCSFILNGLAPNSEVVLNCIMDLKGETILLPNNTTLKYEGGKIENGTLTFGDQGKIDSELIDISLNLNGSVSLANNTFKFIPERWKITKGKVDDLLAETNRKNFQTAINISKELGATIFETDTFDAYIKIDPPSNNSADLAKSGISIPSNFHLKMTDNTFIRVQPNNSPWGGLINVYLSENVMITGGTLIGDRYEHDYSDVFDLHGHSRGTHEWPGLLVTSGAKDITIDNITLKSSTGDGFIAGSAAHRTIAGTKWNQNIKLINSNIIDNRRNNISITDGENILIKNNKILDAGKGRDKLDASGNIIYSSAGVNPRYGLDVEPYVEYADFTFESRIQFEWAEDITIIDNTFKGNLAGSIIVFSGDDILIEGNFSDHSISQNNTSNSNIIGNTIIARGQVSGRAGITTSDFRTYVDFVGELGTLKQNASGNNVIGNTIEGFTTGMRIRGTDAEVTGNTIKRASTCLIIDRTENTDIHNNTYSSNKIASKAILLDSYGNNVKIHDEVFTLENGFYLFAKNFNTERKFGKDIDDYTVEIYSNEFNSKRTPRIVNVNGVKIMSNKINSGIEVVEASNFIFNENNVNADFISGIRLENTGGAKVLNNTFSITGDFDAIKQVDIPTNNTNTINGNIVN